MPTKPLSEEIKSLLEHTTDPVAHIVDRIERAYFLGQTELAQKVLTDVIGEDEDYNSPDCEHQMEEVVGRNDLRDEQRTKLAQLLKKEG